MADFTPLSMLVPSIPTDNFEPAQGWRLYFFRAGTTTETQVYSDAQGTSLGTYVTLNARGEPDTNIWLDTSVVYKIALYEGDRATEPVVWTRDNLTPSAPAGANFSWVHRQSAAFVDSDSFTTDTTITDDADEYVWHVGRKVRLHHPTSDVWRYGTISNLGARGANGQVDLVNVVDSNGSSASILNEDLAVWVESARHTITVDSVSDLQSGTFPSYVTRLYLSGYYGVGTPGGGHLYYDSGDTTTADNGGTVFVDADGKRWKRPEKDIVSLSDFGVLADSNGTTGNGTDNISALQNVASWIQTLGGGVVLTGPEGVVRFVHPGGDTAIFGLSSINGIHLALGGTEFFDDTSYDLANDELGFFFKLTGCNSITGSVKKFTATEHIGPGTANTDTEGGFRAFYFLQGCRDIDLSYEMSGGSTAFQAWRDKTDTNESNRSKNIRLALKTRNVDQPFNLNRSGNNCYVSLENEGGGRLHWIEDVSNVKYDVLSKNHQKEAPTISPLTNVHISYIDNESDTLQASQSLLGLIWDSRNIPVAFNNVSFYVHFAPSTDPGGPGRIFLLSKTDGTGTATTTDVGAVVNRLVLGGL